MNIDQHASNLHLTIRVPLTAPQPCSKTSPHDPNQASQPAANRVTVSLDWNQPVRGPAPEWDATTGALGSALKRAVEDELARFESSKRLV